jgi:hypothetical protein
LRREGKQYQVTRRELGAALLAGTAAAQTTQTQHPLPAGPAAESQAARDQNRRSSEALGAVALPMATEPAFHFTA